MPDTSRIFCPQCGANNFPGQPRCFRCSAPLPPPEAVGFAPPAVPRPAATAHAAFGQMAVQPRRSGLQAALVIAVVALALMVGGVAVGFRVHRAAPSRSGLRSDLDELDQLRRQAGSAAPATSAPTSEAPNETERELDRLREKYHIGDPGAGGSSSGSAGPITFDQYQHGERVAPAYEFH